MVSGREGVAKPDPAVFRPPAEPLRPRPGRHRLRRRLAGQRRRSAAAGLTALVFTGADRLRADLSRLGLLDGAGSG